MKFLLHQRYGLGNQMFQYVAGCYFARKYSAALELVVQHPVRSASLGYPRPFLMTKFAITAPYREETAIDRFMSSQKAQYRLLVAPCRFLTRTFVSSETVTDPISTRQSLSISTSARVVHLIGQWQAHQFADAIEPVVRKQFAFKEQPTGENARVLEQIQRCANPVSVHVRQGDYKNFRNKDSTLSLQYYKNALTFIRQQVPDPTFVVFSDEPEFAREQLSGLGNAIFVAHNDEFTAHEDMRLMSSCKHHIIANSSFSWWGAWLNSEPSKLVCAPTMWIGGGQPPQDLLPPQWHLISSES